MDDSKKKIGVLYLARVYEDLKHFEKFANSYRTYKAGQLHDLIIIYKGNPTKRKKKKLENLFKEFPHQAFFIPDEGYDIHAYLDIAEKINHEFICVFNTYTELVAQDWLKKLYTHLDKPDVGLVGTTASYESLLNSYRLLKYIAWLISKKVTIDEETKKRFAWIIKNKNIRKRLFDLFYYNFSLKRIFKVIIRYLPKLTRTSSSFYLEYDAPILLEFFEKEWNLLVDSKENFNFINDFPSFPNPHIRSNGFMVKRKFLLEFKGLEKTKEACLKFESGVNSFTKHILKKKLKVLLVGANEHSYSLEEWPSSQTFRLKKQKNLILKDNQVTSFTTLSEKERETYTYITWGDYVKVSPSFQTYIKKLGHAFDKHASFTDKKNTKQYF